MARFFPASLPNTRHILSKYVGALKRFRYVLILFWAVLFSLSIVGTLHVYDHVNNTVLPPREYPSWYAAEASKRLYGPGATTTPEIILIEVPESSTYDLVSNGLINNITTKVEDFWKDSPDVSIQGYLSAQALPGAARLFISDNNKSTIMTVMFPHHWTTDKIYGQEQEVISMLTNHFALFNISVQFSGPHTFIKEAPAILEKDLLIIHIFVIPTALAVLALSLRSWRLLLLQLLVMAMSITFSCASLYILSMWIRASSTSPIIMIVIILALSIDYSLILLTRFREELVRREQTIENACVETLRTSGGVILASGGILILCFAWILVIQMFTCVALTFVISLFHCISLTLSVTPTFLLAFPGFFTNFNNCMCHICGSDDMIVKNAPSSQHCGSGKCCKFDPPLWFRWGRIVTAKHMLLAAIVISIVLSIMLGWSSSKAVLTNYAMQYLPRGSSVVEIEKRVSAQFPPGIGGPYVLVFEVANSTTVLSEPFWSTAMVVSESITNNLLADQSHAAMIGLFHIRVPNEKPMSLNLPLVKQLLEPSCKMSICVGVQTAFNSSVNPDHTALKVTVLSDQRPTSTSSAQFVKRLRDVVDKINAKHADVLKVWLIGVSALTSDASDSLSHQFPIFMGAAAGTCLLAVGIVYKSVMIPIRSIFTIALTIIVGFGVLVATHQLGLLQFLHIEPISPAVTSEISWMVATIGFSIILGLALDYDIFLLGRIVEEHDNGLSDEAAIQVGVWKTGPVISLAGAIMTIAFSGLLFSSVPMMNQAGVLLVTAVVFDTCVMRTLITPSLLKAIGRLNWWPRKSPPMICNNAMDILYRDKQSTCSGNTSDSLW